MCEEDPSLCVDEKNATEGSERRMSSKVISNFFHSHYLRRKAQRTLKTCLIRIIQFRSYKVRQDIYIHHPQRNIQHSLKASAKGIIHFQVLYRGYKFCKVKKHLLENLQLPEQFKSIWKDCLDYLLKTNSISQVTWSSIQINAFDFVRIIDDDKENIANVMEDLNISNTNGAKELDPLDSNTVEEDKKVESLDQHDNCTEDIEVVHESQRQFEIIISIQYTHHVAK